MTTVHPRARGEPGADQTTMRAQAYQTHPLIAARGRSWPSEAYNDTHLAQDQARSRHG